MGLRSLATCVIAFVLLCSWVTSSEASQQVALAGIAYSGDYKSKADRFRNSLRFEQSLEAANSSANDRLRKAVEMQPPQHYELLYQLASLKGQDQVIAVALVMTGETVSTEQFGQFYKLFIQLRAQALFFDFKSMTVLRGVWLFCIHGYVKAYQ